VADYSNAEPPLVLENPSVQTVGETDGTMGQDNVLLIPDSTQGDHADEISCELHQFTIIPCLIMVTLKLSTISRKLLHSL
jgi:hypothetical protein